MIGQTLGHYQITGTLGAGGMGVVYRAKDTKLGREVALKVLPTREAGDATARERLVQEARTASALNHPHVCTVFEVGEAGEVTYAVMELVEGRPLGAQIPAEGLPTELALRYGAQIADALAHAHERGVIHRDLKTGNVMITPDGRAKVLDFGLARRMATDELDQVTRSQVSLAEAGRVAGTLHYLAPETLRGAAADARSDIWALGVVLYQMAAGQLPYDGKSGYDVSSAILRDPLPPLPPRVPAGLRAVIQRCLAREPGQRYQRAGEVRAALETIGSSDVTLSSAAVPAVAASQPWWRSKALWATVTLAVLVALALWKGPFVISLGKTEIAPTGPRTSTGAAASANAEANEYFERGIFFLTKKFELQRGAEMLERAMRLDPNFVEARAWYAYSHILQVDAGYSNDRKWLYRAEEDARWVLARDPDSGRGHVVLATIHYFRGRSDQAQVELRRAREINANDFDALAWLTASLVFWGEYEEANETLSTVARINPTYVTGIYLRGDILRETNDPAGAVRELEKILEQDPQNVYALSSLVQSHLQNNDLHAARKAYNGFGADAETNLIARLIGAVVLAAEGKHEAARKVMDTETLKYAEVAPYITLLAAEYYAQMNETENALEWMERAVQNGDERAEWFGRNRLLDGVRNHPRFQRIIESIQFQRQQRQKKAT